MGALAQQVAAPAPPAEDVVDEALWDFGNLRMPSPERGDRGRLVPLAPQESWAEMIAFQQIHVEVDIVQLIAVSMGRAQSVDSVPGHLSLPAPVHGYDYAYEAEHPLDVPSDGAFHNVVLRDHDCATKLRYVTVPRESAQAFRSVEVENPLDVALLDGPIDVYVAGTYAMTTRMRQTGPSEKLVLDIGVEPRIKVARNTSFSEEHGGLMVGHLDLEHQVRVSVENLLDSTATVEVRDRVPVPWDKDSDDIKVKETAVEPSWEKWEPEEGSLRGGRRWVVEVEAGSKRELSARYTIRIPSKHELDGGNRRDV